MIHAEKARELTEDSIESIRDDTLKYIEEIIEKTARNGYNSCDVCIHELLLEDIEFILENYDYSVRRMSSFEGKCLLKISW